MYKIQVLEVGGDVVVKEVECESLRKAEKTELGMNINLAFGEYYTRIIDADTGEEV